MATETQTQETQTQDNMTQTLIWLGAALVVVVVFAYLFS
jgi:flagellar biogenesis protein FliO